MIRIYTAPSCPYCIRAKMYLQKKDIAEYEEIDISLNDEDRAQMVELSGGRKTVPQIFIHGTHVGGYDDMVALDKAGGLDALLAQQEREEPNA
jgi:glutaredoxin 3